MLLFNNFKLPTLLPENICLYLQLICPFVYYDRNVFHQSIVIINESNKL